MDGFFDFIFSNFFIVIIILVAVFNLFNKGKNQREESETNSQNRRQEQPEKPSLQERIEQKVKEAKESYQEIQDTIASESKTETSQKTEAPKSIQEQRQEQYEQLKRRLQPSNQRTKDEPLPETRVSVKPVNTSSDQEKLEVMKQFDKKLTRQGLAESIVMAEVLGPPRALNPYQNVAMKRRRQ